MISGGRLLDPNRLRSRLVLVLTAVLTVSVLVLSFFTLAAFDRAIAPELESRTRMIGNLVRGEVQRTLELGIPITSLGGLETYIDHVLDDFPEVRRIAIVTVGGETISEALRPEPPSLFEKSGLGERIGIRSTEFRLPVLVGVELVGEIVIEGSPQFAETRLRDVVLDVAVLALAALLIGVEIALAAAAASVWKPFNRVLAQLEEQGAGRFVHVARISGVSTLRRVAGRLNDRVLHLAACGGGAARPRRLLLSDLADVRLPLFLFVTGTEITAAFLPVFAATLARPAWLAAETASAAPIFAYLVFVAVLMPFADALGARFGPRRLFLAALLPAFAGLLGSALAGDILTLTVAQAMVAAGYALAATSAGAYGRRAAGEGGESLSLGAVIATTVAGSFCGSVIGGVLAGRFGYPAAILCGAVFALAAGAAAMQAMRGRAGEPGARPAPAATLRAAPVSHRGPLPFGVLVLGVSVPAAAVTAVFVWYPAPLLAEDAGLRPADTARVVMLYPLATILLGPLVAARAAAGGLVSLVLAGALVTAAALLSLGLGTGVWPLVGAVAGVGVGHAILRPPLQLLSARLAEGMPERRRLVGPVEDAITLAALGFSSLYFRDEAVWSAPVWLGGIAAAGSVAFLLAGLRRGVR